MESGNSVLITAKRRLTVLGTPTIKPKRVEYASFLEMGGCFNGLRIKFGIYSHIK